MNTHAQQETSQNDTKIEELESIRGLAALLVVFFHIPKWNPTLDIRIINNGYLMVDLFFVLSGFVIYNAYVGKINSAKDLFRFQFLRFGRLYPVHIMFLIAFIFIEITRYLALSKLGITIPDTKPFSENNLKAIFQHLFLIQAILPTNNAATFNGPAWSISVEFYTYLIFGAGIFLAEKKKNVLFSLLAFASVLLLVSETTFGLKDFLRCLAGFFIGCLTALATNKFKTNVPKYFSLMVFVAIALFLQLKTSKQYNISIYFLTAAMIASIVLSRNGYLNNILNLKMLTWLGSVSYAIYMSHAAIIWVVIQALRFVLKKPEMLIHGISTPQLSKTESLFAFVILMIIVLSFSAFVHRFIEKPMREKSRRFAFSKLNND